jgi:hypothetical protein
MKGNETAMHDSEESRIAEIVERVLARKSKKPLTSREACDYLHCGLSSLWRFCKTDGLKAIQAGRRKKLLFLREDLDKFLLSRGKKK